jgi:uncharacterized protein with von Willebrand factor type A (vWA) domain
MKAKLFALAAGLDPIAIATEEMAQMTDAELCAGPLECANLAQHIAAIRELRHRAATRKPRYARKLRRRVRVWTREWQPGWGKVLTRRVTLI